jgi:hypothetical protein
MHQMTNIHRLFEKHRDASSVRFPSHFMRAKEHNDWYTRLVLTDSWNEGNSVHHRHIVVRNDQVSAPPLAVGSLHIYCEPTLATRKL